MMVGQQVGAMANPKHLAQLKRSVEIWNRWRREHPRTYPDLSYADLGGWNLAQSDFSRSLLDFVDLKKADLRGANFTEAQINGVDIRNAKCQGANFRDAEIFDTTFLGSDLDGSDFTDAEISLVAFIDVDLSNVKGLDRVEHGGRCMIGIDTIYRSQGKIPESFLRGAGVPESFVVYMKSLIASANPVEFYSCFISYSSRDYAFATELHSKLQTWHVRCWKDSEDLKIGDRFQDVIESAIRVHDKLLVVLSENSVNSPWVEREVQAAFEKEQQQGSTVLFPVRLDDAVMDCPRAWAADIRRTRHIGDFRKWKDHDSFQKSLDHLLRDLKSLDAKPT